MRAYMHGVGLEVEVEAFFLLSSILHPAGRGLCSPHGLINGAIYWSLLLVVTKYMHGDARHTCAR
jgi:hypothetical protein